eukprot:TRINITY_DN191_c0_g2_i1.p1 TRINITY_DN191_c0_g2~~TRINITY_DN191_c0_g2_i1.p1  ORF type:complete len:416 (-),score=134.48 TRINITY_DN191_c0_g2_i1:327-1574(-)
MPFKIRLGFIVGKDFDPIPVGSQDRDYPEKFKYKNNTGKNASGWGGQYHIDVATGHRVGKLHPDLLKIDLIRPDEVTPQRLAKNHLNFNMWHDLGVAALKGDKTHFNNARKAFSSENSRMWPTWETQEWIYHKAWYISDCQKAGIPMIPTIPLMNGFDSKSALKRIQQKGWSKFFIKPGYLALFSNGTFKGKTKEIVADPSPLKEYEKDDAKPYKEFLIQPYMLKPDGDVFDEIRNFFIDGEWAYSVFTHGTDDDKVFTQPEGPLKEKCKKVATKAYKEYLKHAKWWDGKPFVPPITRVDVGVIPLGKTPPEPWTGKSGSFKVFINEIEWDQCTLLARYCPFDLRTRYSEVLVKKTHELLTRLLRAGKKVPDAKEVQKSLDVLAERLGGSASGGAKKRAAPESTSEARPKKARKA